MAKKMNGMMIAGWILIVIGLIGVVGPHTAFLIDRLETLSTIGHATFELISAAFILVGAILLGMGCRK